MEVYICKLEKARVILIYFFGQYLSSYRDVVGNKIIQVCFVPLESILQCEETMLVGVAQSYSTLCNPVDYSLSGSSVHGILPARIMEWFCHALLWGIIPTQGSNPGLLHCRWILYLLSHQGSSQSELLIPQCVLHF